MNNPITLEQLYKEIGKEIKKGNGKKICLLSDDDEGNGFHQMFFTITTMKKYTLKTLEHTNLHGMSAKDAYKFGIIIG